MHKKWQGTEGGVSGPHLDSVEPKMDIKSILKDIEFLGSSHMTWKQKKDLENKKVVSLGGKPVKKQRLPLSVARVMMKNQKEREEKLLQERAILGRFGAYSSSSSSTVKKADRRRQEDKILRSTEGSFRNGILDVKRLLQPSATQVSNENTRHTKGGKKKGGKKGHGNRKVGGRKHQKH